MKIWDEGWVSVETREWQTVATHTFVWDGNLPVHETVQRSNGSTVERSYFWGMDKSGTEQGAGGVGGLLAVSIDGAFFIPCYDHNGNIVRYISENGSTAAQYTYDPYGNTIEASGALADQFPFGFSTKYHDRETGFVSYLMRFYNPPDGRWLNRDPIEEQGGENLYAFCGNNGVNQNDALGQTSIAIDMSQIKDEYNHNVMAISVTLLTPPAKGWVVNFVQLKDPDVLGQWSLDPHSRFYPYYYSSVEMRQKTTMNEKKQPVKTLHDRPKLNDTAAFYVAVVEYKRTCCNDNTAFRSFICKDIVHVLGARKWFGVTNEGGGGYI